MNTVPRFLTMAAACSAMLAAPAALTAQSAEDEIVATVDAYHAALVAGDSTTALDLLADDVAILESGGYEAKEHYRSGHLAGDMRYAQSVTTERGDMHVTIVGDVAWSWTTKTTQGRTGDREINSRSAELMVLTRLDGEWKIRAIHWSSRQGR